MEMTPAFLSSGTFQAQFEHRGLLTRKQAVRGKVENSLKLEGNLAEREGFEPPVPFRAHLISSASRSASSTHQSLITQETVRRKILVRFVHGDRPGMVRAHFRHRVGHNQGTGKLFALEESRAFEHALD